MNTYYKKIFMRNTATPEHYEAFQKAAKTNVLIVGVGGVGAVNSAMLSRYGFAANAMMYLADFDIIEKHNLNRQNFKKHIGLYKVDVSKNEIEAINPFAKVITYKTDITLPSFRKTIEPICEKGNLIVFNNTDNRQAAEYISDLAFKYNLPLVHGGASPSLPAFFVQAIVPGKSPCARCVNRYFLSPENKTEKAKGSGCQISLPFTMTMLAAKMGYKGLQIVSGNNIDYSLSFHDMETDTIKKISLKSFSNCSICGSAK